MLLRHLFYFMSKHSYNLDYNPTTEGCFLSNTYFLLDLRVKEPSYVFS